MKQSFSDLNELLDTAHNQPNSSNFVPSYFIGEQMRTTDVNSTKKREANEEFDVFISSHNKTTEQKYAELKVKYNDLLSNFTKHVALAASQKTEDFRVDPGRKTKKAGGKKSKQSLEKQMFYGV